MRADGARNRRRILRLYADGVDDVATLSRRLKLARSTVRRWLAVEGLPLTARRSAVDAPLRRAPYWELRLPGAASTAGEISLGRKFCAGCGRWRGLCDFPPVTTRNRRGRPSARCVACIRIANRYYHSHMTDEARALLRERRRFYDEAKRREAGTPARARHRPSVVDRPEYVYLDAAPIVAELEQHYRGAVNGFDNGAYLALARASGVSARRIWGLRNGESVHVRVDVADKLAVALGVPLATIYREDR